MAANAAPVPWLARVLWCSHEKISFMFSFALHKTSTYSNIDLGNGRAVQISQGFIHAVGEIGVVFIDCAFDTYNKGMSIRT